MIIGITGGTGCGKTTLLDVIREAGGLVLDCDAIYHELLRTDKDLLTAIENRFPGTVENGQLQRKKLGAIVFADKAALEELSHITGRFIGQELNRQLSTNPKLAAIDAIRLFEGGLNKRCDVTVAVTAPTETRVQRLMARDNITEEYARSRIAAQPPEEFFAEKSDYLLRNDGTMEAFREKCLAFLREQSIIE